jgi:hypothetical protein
MIEQTPIKKLFEVLHIDLTYANNEEIISSIDLINDVQSLDGSAVSTLDALYTEGPLFDGDIPSKSGRDSLVENGYAAIVIVKGLEGYNACTQKGYWAHQLLKEMGEVK